MSTGLKGFKDTLPQTPGELRTGYAFVLGVIWAFFHLYAGIRHVSILQLVHIHVCLALSMTFAIKPTEISFLSDGVRRTVDMALTLTPLGLLGYLLAENQRLVTRIP